MCLAYVHRCASMGWGQRSTLGASSFFPYCLRQDLSPNLGLPVATLVGQVSVSASALTLELQKHATRYGFYVGGSELRFPGLYDSHPTDWTISIDPFLTYKLSTVASHHCYGSLQVLFCRLSWLTRTMTSLLCFTLPCIPGSLERLLKKFLSL